ncbi:TonB-dependent receptor [Sphingopyxis sp. LC81]|uniref:TonB-dependent receptor n=1 Tax=Sphingopyxis sp. LC81 TaxID=1502850 RepID=UPI00051071EE|nr:TonB-dependent receptor [Sphingopyxis sp. LC81]KGB55770.1 TonB-dependent receptor [Sphingopyxis sp. LC81]
MKRIWTSATALCAVLAVTTPAFAQDAAPTDEQTGGFGEIIVTAQKRAENLQDVPISATVVSADALASRQIFDPSQLQLVAPSLQVKSFNAALGASNFSIRGVGTLSFSNSIEASVTSVIDGVVMGNPSLGFMNYLDLAQIEVLNGPQGMLFGKNASAGLVNITTRRPEIGRFDGQVMGEIAQMKVPGDGLLYRLQGIVNVPLGDKAALRVSAAQTHTDPVITNLVDVPGSQYGQNQTSLRAKLLWEPTSELSIFIAGDYAHSSGVGSGGSADRIVRPTSRFAAENAALGIVANPDNFFSSYGAPTRANFDVGGLQANIDYEFESGHTLTSITAWRKFDADNLFDSDKHRVNLLDTNHQLSTISQFTEELRLASPVGQFFEYQLGLYYYDSKSDSDITAAGANGVTAPPPAGFNAWLGIHSTGSMTSKSYAGFGQGTLNISDRFRFTFGGRYTYDKLKLRSVSDAAGFVIPFGAVGSRNQRISEENFSWRVGAQYDVTADVMAYASVARGYKGPGFNLTIDPRAPLIMPEIPTSYEAGIKSTLLDRHLIFNISGYSSTFKNFQAQAFDTASNGYVLLNAGELKSRGFEIEASALPAEGLVFNLGVSYVDAFFSDFQGDRCYPFQPNCRPNGTIDSSGNRLPNVPKWTVSLTGRYETPVSESLAVFLQGALYARTSSNFSSNEDPNTKLPGYSLFDASIGLKQIDDRYKLTLFCRNCFDKRQPTFINSNSQSRGDYYHMFGLNSFRTLGVSLEGRF